MPRYPVSFAFIVGVLWLIYYFMPAIKQKKSHVLAGAIFAATARVGVTVRQREPVLYGGRLTTTDQIDEPSTKIR